MKCDWVGCGSSYIVELWHPQEGSLVVDGGMKAYCEDHSVTGIEREKSCTRRGYGLQNHQSIIYAQYHVERVNSLMKQSVHAC